MVLNASARPAPWLRHLRFAVLVALGSLVAHDLVVFVRTAVSGDGVNATGEMAGLADMPGMTDAAPESGYWTILTLAAIVVAGLAAAFGIGGIRRLGRALRRLPAAPRPAVPGGGRGYLAELDHLWPRLFAAITIVFTFQENLAHLGPGHAAHGPAILVCPEHPLAIPVLGAISLVLAAVGAWFRWRIGVLEGRLRAARAALCHVDPPADSGPMRRWRLVAADIAHQRIHQRPQAGRAPPAAAGA